MPAELERRSAAVGQTGTSPVASGRPPLMQGRAITYNAFSQDLGGFVEVFRPGSVRLADDLVILAGHDPRTVLGRTRAGTAQAYDDGIGIVFEVEPPDTQWARDLITSMQRGDIGSCSFAFRVLDEYWFYDQALGTVVREVLAAEVSELSVVSMPAYLETEAAVT